MMKRQIWGAIFTALGVMALLQAMKIVAFGLAFWPVVWTLLGGAILVSAFRKVSWFGMALGIWLFGIGLFDILHNAGVSPEVDGGYIFRSGWPVVLVAIGFSMLFGKRWGKMFSFSFDQRHSRIIGDVRMGQGTWTLDGDLDLSHGVGDVKVDLTTAVITDGVHRIHLHAGIGDAVIRVPDNVNVTVTGKVGIGDLEVLGDRRSGFGCKLFKKVVVPESPVELIVEVEMGIGDVDVVQRPASTPRVIA